MGVVNVERSNRTKAAKKRMDRGVAGRNMAAGVSERKYYEMSSSVASMKKITPRVARPMWDWGANISGASNVMVRRRRRRRRRRHRRSMGERNERQTAVRALVLGTAVKKVQSMATKEKKQSWEVGVASVGSSKSWQRSVQPGLRGGPQNGLVVVVSRSLEVRSPVLSAPLAPVEPNGAFDPSHMRDYHDCG